MFGQCCAFCSRGSGIGVYTAPHPLGPWSGNGGNNVGCNATTAAERGGDACGCALDIPRGANYTGTSQCHAARAATHDHAVTWAQQNSVIKVTTQKQHTHGAASMVGNSRHPADGDFDTTFIWTGDRWQSACTATVAEQGVPPTDVELHCVKAYDLQYWAPLEWDDTLSPPLPRQFTWRATWSI